MEIRGKVRDICPNCKNHKSVTSQYDGKEDLRIIEVKCEDPYDGMVKTLDADSDICCSRFCDKISSLEDEIEKLRLTLGEKTEDLHELSDNYDELLDKHDKLKCKLLDILQKKEELEARVTELIKASKRKDELIQSYREKNKNYEQILIDISRFVPVDVTDFKDLPMIIEQMRKTGDMYDALFDQKYDLEKDLGYWKERCHKAETDVTTLNSKVEVLEKKFRKADSIRDAVWNEEELKQKISDLETTISSKNTYIDILLNTNKDLTESNENLTKMIERRDRWVKEFKSDVYTLQNEILRIRNIAQKAYDDTNRD